ncbi:uncharacterized protein LOC135482935, partial [Lineus longissimus]|uniref:uncharacterized protein LOC135482935 n=1 Tax=Lineus longissimus TaxID=88925 RepID=UPI00315D9437
MSQLKVKFNWNLRSSKCKEKTDIKQSRTCTYVKHLKESNVGKYYELKKKDADRKREAYVPADSLSDLELEQQRKKWAKQKKEQREKQKRKREDELSQVVESIQDEPPKKRFKDLNTEERKAYFREKMAEKRKKTSKQKEMVVRRKDRATKKASCAGEQNDVPSSSTPLNSEGSPKPSSSRTTLFRAKKKILLHMPKTPKSYSRVCHDLLRSGPANNQAKKKLAFPEVMKENVKKVRTRPTNKNRAFLYQLGKCVTWKYGRRSLGLSWRTWKAVKAEKDVKKMHRRGKVIPQATKELVQDFWWSSDISRQLPLKKRVKKNQAAFLFEMSYMQAYLKFRSANPTVRIGYVKFVALKPWNVRRMGALERVVCCCQKCQNIKLKIRALNQAATATGHREAKIQEDDLAQISKITLCKESDSNRPAAKCINRECTVCGVKKISEHFREMKTNNGNKTVKYEIWLRVKKTKDVKGVKKEITVTEPVTKEATVGELIDLLEQGMVEISAHLFRAAWQQKYLKKAKTEMKPHSAVVVIDFAENYSCTNQDEVQSGHWGDKPQATIHPVMAFINKGNDHGPFTHKAALIFISDEKKHDADAVATYMSIAYPYLRKEYGVTHVEEFSDCCAAQYRCGKSFADFSFYEHDFAVSVQHNYFESSHGKSSADGLGAVVKHRATVAVTRRQATIRNAEELYQFCVTNFSDVGQSCFPAERKKYTSSARKFFYVKKEDIEHQRPSRAVKSVPGTMKIHCLKPTGQPYQIETRILSCFCQTCAINPAVGVCDNREY